MEKLKKHVIVEAQKHFYEKNWTARTVLKHPFPIH